MPIPSACGLRPARTRRRARLATLGVPLFVVSNQPGIARGLLTDDHMRVMQGELSRLFFSCGATFAGRFYCPHAFACECRKPKPGLLIRAAVSHGVDLSQSWMIGDILDDIETGRRAGCLSMLIDNGNESEWRRSPTRTPHHCVDDLAAAASFIAALTAADRRHLTKVRVAHGDAGT